MGGVGNDSGGGGGGGGWSVGILRELLCTKRNWQAVSAWKYLAMNSCYGWHYEESVCIGCLSQCDIIMPLIAHFC